MRQFEAKHPCRGQASFLHEELKELKLGRVN